MENGKAKEDLRVVKTRKALLDALTALLERQTFRDMRIGGLCARAVTCRSAFYDHFIDKYDLLRQYLYCIAGSGGSDAAQYVADLFVGNAPKHIRNIFRDADAETMNIMREFIKSQLSKAFGGRVGNSAEHAMLLDFCAGGIMHIAERHDGKGAAAKECFIRLIDSIAQME